MVFTCRVDNIVAADVCANVVCIFIKSRNGISLRKDNFFFLHKCRIVRVIDCLSSFVIEPSYLHVWYGKSSSYHFSFCCISTLNHFREFRRKNIFKTSFDRFRLILGLVMVRVENIRIFELSLS